VLKKKKGFPFHAEKRAEAFSGKKFAVHKKRCVSAQGWKREKHN